MVDLVTVNQVLDIILKLLGLGTLIIVVLVLKDLDHAIKTMGKSAKSIKKSADSMNRTLSQFIDVFEFASIWEIARFANKLRKKKNKKDGGD